MTIYLKEKVGALFDMPMHPPYASLLPECLDDYSGEDNPVRVVEVCRWARSLLTPTEN
jgi:hypothetical protein